MLSFIERRPSLPVGLESMEGYPPVTKALHIDASTEVYQLAQEDKQTTLLVLSRHADSSVLPAWWGQLTAYDVQVLDDSRIATVTHILRVTPRLKLLLFCTKNTHNLGCGPRGRRSDPCRAYQ